MKKEKTTTINVTPKWENLTPMFFNWIENGLESQSHFAKKEINRLAKIVDTFMEHRNHGGLTCQCGEEFYLS